MDVVSVDDTPLLTGYPGSMGLEDLMPPIDITRVQYDLYNHAGNGSIFEFRVDYHSGATVVGAGNPRAYVDLDGTIHTHWNASNHTILFDDGYGTYDYDLDFGGKWQIVYAPGHVTCQHLGDGFFPGTATGRSDLASVLPSFRISFAEDTPLGWKPAEVRGFLNGAPVVASGVVLSAVPEPGGAVLAALGAVLGLGRCRSRPISRR